MNRRLTRSLVLGTGLVAALSSSAFAYPAAPLQVVDVTAPTIASGATATTDEILGPRSRFTITATNAVLGAAAVTEVRLVALNAAGQDITSFPLTGANGALGNTVGNTFTSGANGAATFFDLSVNTNDDFIFTAPGVVSIGVTISTNGAPTDLNRVATLFSAIETPNLTGDECFRIDNVGPQLSAAYINAGTLFLVFNEPLSAAAPLVGANNVVTNQTTIGAADGAFNTTTLANPIVENLDFQYLAASPFTFADATPVSTAVLGNSALAAGNTVISFPITTANNLVTGGQIRPLMVGASGAGAVRDIAGNLASQLSATAGVPITPPPAFNVVAAQWNRAYTAGGATNNGELRIVYSSPVNVLGNNTFYEGAGTGSLTRGGVDSTINFSAGTVAPDPTNPNAVLIGIAAPAGADRVWQDGRDTAGNSYSWIYSLTTGTLPTDIFGATLTTTPAAPLPVVDKITPSQVGAPGWNDTLPAGTRDGKVDTVAFVYDEPVTTNAAAGSFTFTKVAAAVSPVGAIDANGNLVTRNVVLDGVTPANNNFAATTVGVGNGRLPAGTPARLQIGNALNVGFNPDAVNWDNDAATAVGSTAEAIPGTGGPTFASVLSTAAFNVTDGNTASPNVLAVPIFGATNVTQDLAPPFVTAAWFQTGDNFEAGNQLVNEQDATPGDQLNNNLLIFIASENLAPAGGLVQGAQVGFGPGGVNSFNAGNVSLNNITNNRIAFINNAPAAGNPALVAGVAGSIRPGSLITDAAGNETTTNDRVTTDRSAPYIPIIADVNGVNAFAASYTDSNGDSFVNEIRLTTTQAINTTTVQGTDFLISLGTITNATASGNDIVITVADGVIPVTAAVQISYLGNTDPTRIASTATAPNTGVAVSAVAPAGTGVLGAAAVGTNDNVFNAQRTAPATRDTQNVAIMDVVGRIDLSGSGSSAVAAPVGTKIYAMIATPVAASVSAVHNNLNFTVDRDTNCATVFSPSLAGTATATPGTDAVTSGIATINAFTNYLLGLEEFVYLSRAGNNCQYYLNDKFDVNLAGGFGSTLRDVIQLSITTGNLSNITFTGRGETANDQVSGGRVRLCWDVLRSLNGTVESFYNNGWVAGGQPILSSTVITGNDGRFDLHVSAPISAFDGISRLNSVGRPVIFIVELPSGERFAVTSLVSGVNGAPVYFNPTNRRQTTASQADNAVTLNVNLANIAREAAYPGWNAIPFNRQGGFANTAANRPVLVSEVDVAEVVIPTTATPLPVGAGPLDQFVWWNDRVVDGRWTAADDFNSDGLDTDLERFGGIVVDADCFRHFAFTMTSFGVQVGTGINNFTGGYALGFFNNAGTLSNVAGSIPTYGLFQFGVPFTTNVLFNGSTPATSFTNNATTQGWGLFSTKIGFPNVTDADTANPDLDFCIYFRNNGPTAIANGLKTIEVASRDLNNDSSTSTTDANDLNALPAGQAFFGHFEP